MKALLELVRAPAALSVPGDVLAGAAAAGRPPVPGLALASVLIYWSGMALNDWADREVDAIERPERPIPSGRIRADTALRLAAGLTGAGLVTAAATGGRRALAVAGLLAGAVWAYDLGLKRTPLGPASMAACRSLDVLLGAGPQVKAAAPMALAIGAHTYGISILGRAEVGGATPATVHGALAASLAAATLAAASCLRDGTSARCGAPSTPPGAPSTQSGAPSTQSGAICTPLGRTSHSQERTAALVSAGLLLAGHLAATIPVQAALRTRPDPEQVRKAVRLSILSLIPLQAAAVAGGGRLSTAGALLGALPAGRWLSARLATS